MRTYVLCDGPGIYINNRLYPWEDIRNINTYVNDQNNTSLFIYNKNGNLIKGIDYRGKPEYIDYIEKFATCKGIPITHEPETVGMGTAQKIGLTASVAFLLFALASLVFLIVMVFKACGEETYTWVDDYGYTHKGTRKKTSSFINTPFIAISPHLCATVSNDWSNYDFYYDYAEIIGQISD